MAGRIVALIALGLDDDAAGTAEAKLAADQLARDLVHRAIEERLAEHAQALATGSDSSSSRAASICAASGADPVPPAERFDSSQAPSPSTA